MPETDGMAGNRRFHLAMTSRLVPILIFLLEGVMIVNLQVPTFIFIPDRVCIHSLKRKWLNQFKALHTHPIQYFMDEEAETGKGQPVSKSFELSLMVQQHFQHLDGF